MRVSSSLARVVRRTAAVRVTRVLPQTVKSIGRISQMRTLSSDAANDSNNSSANSEGAAPSQQSGGKANRRAPVITPTGEKDTGTVKWFDGAKGFGFIIRDSGKPDAFVHFTQIQGTGYRALEEGQKVSFELGNGQKGQVAMNVRVEQA